MGHEELKEIGIHAFGHRHKILKAVKEKLSGLPELGMFLWWRWQGGRVVRVLDFESVGPGFESHSEHFVDLFLGCSEL